MSRKKKQYKSQNSHSKKVSQKLSDDEISYESLSLTAKKFIMDSEKVSEQEKKILMEKEMISRLGMISDSIRELLGSILIPNALIEMLVNYYEKIRENKALSTEELKAASDKALSVAAAIKLGFETVAKGMADGVVYYELFTERKVNTPQDLFGLYRFEEGSNAVLSGLMFMTCMKEGERHIYNTHTLYVEPNTLNILIDTVSSTKNEFKWASFFEELD